mmetsp:Transcript_402/g.1418  ORF Transcript_402/g.1418 Transcript_402/m.1418 type:complete len:218 (-) Transcript_402:17-670(-)
MATSSCVNPSPSLAAFFCSNRLTIARFRSSLRLNFRTSCTSCSFSAASHTDHASWLGSHPPTCTAHRNRTILRRPYTMLTWTDHVIRNSRHVSPSDSSHQASWLPGPPFASLSTLESKRNVFPIEPETRPNRSDETDDVAKVDGAARVDDVVQQRIRLCSTTSWQITDRARAKVSLAWTKAASKRSCRRPTPPAQFPNPETTDGKLRSDLRSDPRTR